MPVMSGVPVISEVCLMGAAGMLLTTNVGWCRLDRARRANYEEPGTLGVNGENEPNHDKPPEEPTHTERRHRPPSQRHGLMTTTDLAR
jgi:hypothetical protein